MIYSTLENQIKNTFEKKYTLDNFKLDLIKGFTFQIIPEYRQPNLYLY